MARVILTRDLADAYAGGRKEHVISARTMRGLFTQLEALFPGITDDIETEISVTIDGVLVQHAALEALQPDSEVCFIPIVKGG
ncbi:MAG: MoaD/ThiS family protein [Alphaproteobacteria bacterium]